MFEELTNYKGGIKLSAEFQRGSFNCGFTVLSNDFYKNASLKYGISVN